MIRARQIIRRRIDTRKLRFPSDLHPVLARIYGARDVRSAEELDLGLDRLPSPSGLAGTAEAAALLADAVTGGARVLVVADFDADGATSCALVVRALRAFGAREVDFLVPNRFAYGRGLTPEIAELAARKRPDLLITVDTGIASVEGVAAAKALGMAVLVTDHHLPGERLPQADAVVNPRLPGNAFAGEHLAGVGVAFYVMAALRAVLRDGGWFERAGRPVPALAELLDLVAVGTVADVVPLDRINRILVAQGLARINAGRCRPGIRILLELGGRRLGRVTATDLAYVVGPRINAAGRLEDMDLGIACLLADDPAAARAAAARLDELNRARREIEESMQAQAMAAVARLQLNGEAALPKGLCLFDESWHQGVIGLVAARVRERYHRPVIAFAPAGGEELRGSARSVPGLHIRDALEAVATRHPELLQRYGGHAMAAGLTLARHDLEPFTAAFTEELGRQLTEEDLRGTVWSDGELGPGELTLEFAELLRAAGPWGQGFPEPVFDGVFEVTERRIVGDRHLKLLLRPPQAAPIEAMAFNRAAQTPAWSRVRAAYRLEVNEFRGRRAVQLVLEHLEPG